MTSLLESSTVNQGGTISQEKGSILPSAKIRLVNGKWRVFFEPGIRTAEGLILKSIDAEMEWDTDGIKGFRVPNIPMISPNLEQEFYNEKDMVTK